MILASGEIVVKVLIELCQHVLDGRGMPDEWKTSVIVPIFNPLNGNYGKSRDELPLSHGGNHDILCDGF